MSNGLGNVTAAELIKLRTLPAVSGTIGATLLGATGLAIAFAANARDQLGNSDTPFAGVSPETHTGLQAVGYGQIGLILLGILTAATEYGGSQIGTTLTSVPSRMLVMVGKAIAYLTAASLTAVLAVAATFIAAHIALGEHGLSVRESLTGRSLGIMLGAAAYLVLIGLLAYAVAILTRNLVAALVTMLALVLVASPFLRTVTTLAAYLPDLAGAQMYQTEPFAHDTMTPLQGAVVMTAWIALTLAWAVVAFHKRDA